MLNHIAIWQMVIDACLVTSILVMAFRFAKSSRTQSLLPRIVELEGRISVLMAETEGRAKQVTDQLMRREQSLSRYVSEAERYQKELSLVLNEGESLAKELSLLSEGARRETVELERAIVESRSIRDVVRIPSSREHPRDEKLEIDSGLTAAAHNNESLESKDFSTRGASRRASQWIEDASTRDSRGDSRVEQRHSMRALQDSYRAAEEMLKSGRNAEEVSERTRLPIEGVQRLAQMIEIGRDDHEDAPARYVGQRASSDPRLGALGALRRAAPTA